MLDVDDLPSELVEQVEAHGESAPHACDDGSLSSLVGKPLEEVEKLRDDTTVTHSATTATAHMWIEQPLSGVGDAGRFGALNRMFDTHPPLEERIALLREL